jgi:predicted lipoprotein with Yx(FWY)xxD motif
MARNLHCPSRDPKNEPSNQSTFTGGISMKNTDRIIAVLLLGTLFIVTAMTVDRARAAEEEQTPAVKVAEKGGIGRYLTDEAGMTLYYFTQDSTNMSVCSGICLKRWPIFYAEITVVPMGMHAGDFSVITRDDGKKQSTYKGRPIYYYYGDSSPGDTDGQGAGGVWYVVSP